MDTEKQREAQDYHYQSHHVPLRKPFGGYPPTRSLAIRQ
jgi:hypothetical protein